MPALVNSLNVTSNTKTILDVTIRTAVAILSPFESTHVFQDFHPVTNSFYARNVDLAPRYMPITNYWAQWQKRVLQIVAIATAAISVVTALATSYWFFRMRKRLRHNLIMFLITGDLIRAAWMLIIASVSLKDGQVRSSSGICQASGWFVQFGTVMNDWAAFALAVHGAIQIIRPSVNTMHSTDMMFVYRHYIYAALFIIPVLCSTLNYSVRTGRYTASGAFCMLPVRPLWSRLALSWIPRYIIGMTILGLTIAVYVHVRNVYKGTGRTRWWALSSIAVPKDTSDPSQPSVEASAHMQSSYARESHATGDTFDAFSLTNSDAAPSRRLSTLTTAAASTPARTPKWDETTFTNLNLPAPPARFGGQRRSVVSISSSSSSTGLPPRRIRSFDLPPHTRDESLASADPANTLSIPPPTKPRRASAQRPSLTRISSTFSGLSNRSRGSKTSITLPGALTLPNPARLLKRSRILSSASNHLRSQRAAIRRHLRLTFIYPLVYIAMWLCPFILHCMQYNDYFAANLPFALGVVATLCYTLMAAVDCAIFGYREKPWRHMTGGGDGTFLGSFCPWRRGGGGGGGGGRMMSGQVDGSSRWESWDEKGGSRSRRNKRTRRGESIDSDLDIAPDAHAPAVGLVIDEERTIDSGGFGRAEPSSTSTGRRLNTLATIDSSEITNENASQRHTSQQTQEPFLSNVTEIPARLRRTASAAPKQLSRQPGRIARRLHLARSLSKRSDAEKLASEHAKARLKQELQDRRAMEEEKMTTSEGWACAVGSVTCNTPNKGPKERHWWDVVRKDSEAVAWGGSRRGTRAVMLDVVSSPSESEPASPGLSPGQSPDEHGGHVGVSSKEKAQEDIATKQRSNEKQEDKEPGRSLV